MKNSYMVENDLIIFRRALPSDNFEEIARLLYETDPYIYPYWFNNNEDDFVDFMSSEILKDGFIFNYNNLYVAYDTTTSKIVGVVCALDKSIDLNYNYAVLSTINERYNKTIKDYILPIIEEVKENEIDTIYIPNVCVDMDFRGKKIGTNLLGYFIKQMEIAGYNNFELDCLLHNLPAKNLYHSLGFREMRLINGFTGDDSKLDVVSFLRKKGAYLPEEYANYKKVNK